MQLIIQLHLLDILSPQEISPDKILLKFSLAIFLLWLTTIAISSIIFTPSLISQIHHTFSFITAFLIHPINNSSNRCGNSLILNPYKMTTVRLTLLLLFLPIWAFSQIRFSVEIKGSPNDYILVEKPVQGNFFPSSPEKVLIGKKNRFLIECADETPGFMKIHLGGNRVVKVFNEPGRTNSLFVDLANFPKSIKFEGPSAAQNRFLNELERQPLPLLGAELLAVRSDENEEKKPKDYYLDALDNIEAEKNILQRKGKKKFSSAFISAMEKEITYYHTCRFSEMVASDYRLFAQNEPSRFTSKWALYWSKIFEEFPLADDANGVTEHYTLALDYYLGDYRLGYQGDAIYEDPDLEIGEQFLEYDRLLWNEFEGASLEYALASVLSQRALIGKNEAVLFDLFQKFKNDFPNSHYLKHFETAVAAIGESLQGEVFELPEGISQLDAEHEINSVEDIMDRFKGKVVYLDIWATWCSPCLFEFRQKKPLEKFVEGKDIVLVFVSVDNEDRREKWQKTIVDNDLKGYHVLANFSLRDELIDKFGDGSNLALPHYMIFDKNGNLADGDAKQPSRYPMLFKDLERYID